MLAFADGKKDFTPLLYLRLDYESQTSIQQDRVEMITALLVHCNMDPGLAVSFLGGEFMGEGRDIKGICTVIAPHVQAEDLDLIGRILVHGCPAEFQLTESSESKFEILSRGNQKSFEQNKDIAENTMNKEDKHSHLLACSEWVVEFSENMRHTLLEL